MARGMVNNEAIQSQAATDEFRENHSRIFGDRPKNVRGRWIWDEGLGKLVRAEDYRPPDQARDAPIIADRIHEGTYFDDGSRVRDLGSRRKRREFMRETGVTERSDFGPNWSERQTAKREREVDHRTHTAVEQAKRKLYAQGKFRG